MVAAGVHCVRIGPVERPSGDVGKGVGKPSWLPRKLVSNASQCSVFETRKRNNADFMAVVYTFKFAPSTLIVWKADGYPYERIVFKLLAT